MLDEKRQVKKIWWNGVNGDETLTESEDRRLVYFQMYMGDRSDEWIAEEHNGVETRRHNCRYIATIEWA